MGSHRYCGARHAQPPGPRHAKPLPPSSAHLAFAATGVAAAIVAAEGMAGSAGAVTPDTWAKLRMCESTGNYATNTGNGFYGAYQFTLPTWQGLGLSGLPSNAAPAVQDEAALELYNSRGWQPWPACSAKLGLVDDRQASRSDIRVPLAPVTPVPVSPTPAPIARPTTAPVQAPTGPAVAPVAPAPKVVSALSGATGWDGHFLTTRDVGQVRVDASAWQRRMVAAGYSISVDGRYGPQSAAAATKFEASHALLVERPGIVGPQVWRALFGK